MRVTETYQREARYWDKWPKQGEVWLHFRRFKTGFNTGWGEWTLITPGMLTGSSLRQWESWELLEQDGYRALGKHAPDGDLKVIVRNFDHED
jgi:hypothetical protein